MEYFWNELKNFELPKVKQFAQNCIANFNDAFFTAGASSTGKYHPNYAQGEGGLYRHTCAALRFAETLFCIDSVNELFELDVGYRDAIRLALLVHDSCKSGRNWDSKYTVHEHPLLAEQFLQEMEEQYNENGDLTIKQVVRVACDCVRTNMGQWNKNPYMDTVLPVPETKVQIFTHICDYLASRKDFEVQFN